MLPRASRTPSACGRRRARSDRRSRRGRRAPARRRPRSRRRRTGAARRRVGHRQADQQEHQRIGDEGGELPEDDDRLSRPARSARSGRRLGGEPAEIAHHQAGRDRRQHARGADALGDEERAVGDDRRQRRLDQMVVGAPGERDRQRADARRRRRRRRRRSAAPARRSPAASARRSGLSAGRISANSSAAAPSLNRLSLSMTSRSRPLTPASRSMAMTAIGSVAAISAPNASAGAERPVERPDRARRRRPPRRRSTPTVDSASTGADRA